MAAGSGNSAAGVLTQLSEASNPLSDEQDNEVDKTINIISSTSTSLMLTSKARDGDSSSGTTIDSTSRKASSSLYCQYYSKLTVASLIFRSTAQKHNRQNFEHNRPGLISHYIMPLVLNSLVHGWTHRHTH